MRFSSISKKISIGIASFVLLFSLLLQGKVYAQFVFPPDTATSTPTSDSDTINTLLNPPHTNTPPTPDSEVIDALLNPSQEDAVNLDPVNQTQNLTTDQSMYNLLSPLGTFKQFSLACTVDQTGKEVCPGLSEFLGTIFSLAIALAGVLAVIMIMMGGWTLMYSDSFTGREEGKKKIYNAIIGLILALGSYLLLNTLNPDLVNLSLQIQGQTIAIDESEGDAPQTTPVSGAFCAGRVQSGAPWTPPDDTSERTQLSQGGVTVNKSNCATVGSQSCTSVKGLSSTAIQKLIQLKNTCVASSASCKIEVTGGTECWLHHPGTKHFPGGSTVDIHNDSVFVQYIKDNSTNKKDPKSGWIAYEMNKGPFSGAVFVQEGDHFHVKNW